MEIEIVPEPDEEERAALVEVLARGAEIPTGSESPWRAAALREGVEDLEP